MSAASHDIVRVSLKATSLKLAKLSASFFKMNSQTMSEGNAYGQEHPIEGAAWKEIVRKYQKPSRWGSAWQIINTLGSYIDSG